MLRTRLSSAAKMGREKCDLHLDRIALLKLRIPGIKVLVNSYLALNDYKDAWRGVALYEYDRNADGKGNPDWRLWNEQSSIRGRELDQLPPN